MYLVIFKNHMAPSSYTMTHTTFIAKMHNLTSYHHGGNNRINQLMGSQVH